jgi:hypothetical protein
MQWAMHKLVACLVLAALVGCAGSATGAPPEDAPAIPDSDGLQVLSLDFSGTRAFELLQRQVSLGPRVPGSNNHAQCRELIADELEPYCASISEQVFRRTVNGRDYTFRNIIAHVNPDAAKIIVLAAHYDTRPFADRDRPENYSTPIPGANDGASGVAVLLELARVLHGRLPDDVGILFLFTDGEDTGLTASQMFCGAEYFVSQMSYELKSKIEFGILLDMVGDASLNIKPEKHSEAVAPEIYDALLELQSLLGLSGFSEGGQYNVQDDHIAFIEQGIKMYDVIDFDYSYWHTLEDTVERCSAESLRVVGLCVSNLILNYGSGRFNL